MPVKQTPVQALKRYVNKKNVTPKSKIHTNTPKVQGSTL